MKAALVWQVLPLAAGPIVKTLFEQKACFVALFVLFVLGLFSISPCVFALLREAEKPDQQVTKF